jgi:putative zinc finger/helix-turn-helix YgiT family protein
MKTKNCPKGHGDMLLNKIHKTTTFKGVDLLYDAEVFICPTCGLEAATIEETAAIQRSIADAYRKQMNLLTGEEIREYRKIKGMTQKDLAGKIQVGIASIKRWETGAIQTPAMDLTLRRHLQSYSIVDVYSGNREFSINRIKCVADCFEKILQKKLLMKDDKFLFLSKYLWYADMLAFKNLGFSMTGAQYAALPFGPQLNNYRDLVDAIKKADTTVAEPLSLDEERIIKNICKKYPNKGLVYNAAHREKIWKEKPNGAPILYSDASMLTEI